MSRIHGNTSAEFRPKGIFDLTSSEVEQHHRHPIPPLPPPPRMVTMLGSRTGALGPVTRSAHVCLSCRFKAQRRLRHSDAEPSAIEDSADWSSSFVQNRSTEEARKDIAAHVKAGSGGQNGVDAIPDADSGSQMAIDAEPTTRRRLAKDRLIAPSGGVKGETKFTSGRSPKNCFRKQVGKETARGPSLNRWLNRSAKDIGDFGLSIKRYSGQWDRNPSQAWVYCASQEINSRVHRKDVKTTPKLVPRLSESLRLHQYDTYPTHQDVITRERTEKGDDPEIASVMRVRRQQELNTYRGHAGFLAREVPINDRRRDEWTRGLFEHATEEVREQSIAAPQPAVEEHQQLRIVPSIEAAVNEFETNLDSFQADVQPTKYVPDWSAESDEPVSSPTASSIKLRKPAEKRAPKRVPFGGFAWQRKPIPTLYPETSMGSGAQLRLYHSSSAQCQHAATLAEQESIQPHYFQPGLFPDLHTSERPSVLQSSIRTELRKWQKLHGQEDSMPDILAKDDITPDDQPVNNFTRLPPESGLSQGAEAQDEAEAQRHMMISARDGPDDPANVDPRFLNSGDLVELEFARSERESLLAVYLRPIGTVYGQFFTMQGRWIHVHRKNIPYSIPGWISPKLVKPLLEYLPDALGESDIRALEDQAMMEDMSIPRMVSAPIVERLVQFHQESQAIYRQHADALDNAHDILAHETDLRYGSLTSAASALLKLPGNNLPTTALFTVRKALSHGGFAFNVDRRSHRVTGYMQIRSKNQVKMVQHVRNWIRHWQDDLALTATMSEKQREKHKRSRGAHTLHSFLAKAKFIVLNNRKTREPTKFGNVGPSKVLIPISEHEDCVKVETKEVFSGDEVELVRFMEAWACSGMFVGIPRLESLPPLLLQATGLYPDQELAPSVGFMFLQEMGTVLPYENRIRFDQHLLLPASQHSRPLQNLMDTLEDMRDRHDFSDSMAELRHDWTSMTVYCIDGADAHEIDDGISVEFAGLGADGRKEHWVHVHIANPTAFFSRDHPAAKMARHMGETIYMPERPYMMLPRWATQRHFSLAKDRPVLTFSARLDEDGNTVDQKVQSGVIRKVIRITPAQLKEILGERVADEAPELVLNAGGELPPGPMRKSPVGSMTPAQINELKALHRLAARRAGIRQSAGGLFFDRSRNDLTVRQGWKGTGLAWEHPFRKGSRTVTGDPIIEMRTRGLRNWFMPSSTADAILVREMMLLACQTAASWCAERKIPIIYRTTVQDPARADPDVYFRETLAPAVTKDGAYPMHLGLEYLHRMGSTTLKTTPGRHTFLGLDHFAKVTSPLRRYGDMVVHWQIEAALRHEAATGQSLVTADPSPNRRFLPFSAPVLDTIMVGLQPREGMITHAKQYSEDFWTSMLMFRKVHFPDSPTSGAPLPFSTLRAFVHSTPAGASARAGDALPVLVTTMELNMTATMLAPENYGLSSVARGDVWECVIERVDVYRRCMFMQPLRLLERVDA